MDNVSKLLYEAKPLYYKRKKQQKVAYSSACLLMIGTIFSSSLFYQPYSYNDDILSEYIISIYDNSDITEVDSDNQYLTLIDNILS